ncbi:peroxin-14 [Microdochium nivale]|nr:peroxin-14 [Microdochium nivale]
MSDDNAKNEPQEPSGSADAQVDVQAVAQAEDLQEPSDSAEAQVEEVSRVAEDNNKPTEASLDQARRFLRDAIVRTETAERKTAFLKNKGFKEAEIQQLIEEVDSGFEGPISADSPPGEPAPIITYPEFLTKTVKPPPLATPSSVLNILAVSAGVWTALYGAARYIVNPMAQNLSDSRQDYYDHVNEHLSTFVEKLEGVVSEVPYKNGKLIKPAGDEYHDDDDLASTASDPTEMFHRDFGTQTDPPPSLLAPLDTAKMSAKPVDVQARRLASLRSQLEDLTKTYTQRAENVEDLNAILREIREDVDKLAYPQMDYGSTYAGYSGRSSNPDDEIQKTKDAIRSVKGMFLSSRSFPAVSAR